MTKGPLQEALFPFLEKIVKESNRHKDGKQADEGICYSYNLIVQEKIMVGAIKQIEDNQQQAAEAANQRTGISQQGGKYQTTKHDNSISMESGDIIRTRSKAIMAIS